MVVVARSWTGTPYVGHDSTDTKVRLSAPFVVGICIYVAV